MKTAKDKESPETTRVVERNVNALVQRKKEDLKKRSVTEKFVGIITEFAGSMTSVYFHFILFGIWAAWNLNWLPLQPFDRSFIILATFAAVEAIFLTTFVLIGQRHMNVQSEKWSELDLQINLLTEHEVTKILQLLTTIAKKMDIHVAEGKEIQDLSKDIHPEHVLDSMEKAQQPQDPDI